jgi:hypothetical protein
MCESQRMVDLCEELGWEVKQFKARLISILYEVSSSKKAKRRSDSARNRRNQLQPDLAAPVLPARFADPRAIREASFDLPRAAKAFPCPRSSASSTSSPHQTSHFPRSKQHHLPSDAHQYRCIHSIRRLVTSYRFQLESGREERDEAAVGWGGLQGRWAKRVLAR